MFNEEPNSVAPTLSGRELTRSFGTGEARTTALAEVSLDLYPGQMSLLMGPSGSGKSTLLAVLSGLLTPDSGQALALGQDIWKQTEREREDFRLKHCGFIFQGYNLFGALTARQGIVTAMTTPIPLTDRAITRVAVTISSLNRRSRLNLVHEDVPSAHARYLHNRWTGILYGLGVTLAMTP